MTIQKEDFLDNDNIRVIWGILEEAGVIGETMTLFDFFENASVFYNLEKDRTSHLIEMDKKFLKAMMIFFKEQKANQVNAINQKQINLTPTYKKIKIFDEEIKQPITYEEIKNEKISKFDMALQEKQNEFTNTLTLAKLPEQMPFFKDNYCYDAPPVSELDKEIKRLQEQRKYDLENVRHPNLEENNEWLKTTETNINKEKKIFNEKHVTWAEAEEDCEYINNILLKKKQNNEIELIKLKHEINAIITKINKLEEQIILFGEK
jgi:hypothetical protein